MQDHYSVRYVYVCVTSLVDYWGTYLIRSNLIGFTGDFTDSNPKMKPPL